MVFEYRSRQQVSGPVRAPPLPIIRDNAANQRQHSIVPHFTLTTARQSSHNQRAPVNGNHAKLASENVQPFVQSPDQALHKNGAAKQVPSWQTSSAPNMAAANGRALKQRRKPLTIREYESEFRQRASDLELVERVFHGGMDSNQLRAALWPLIFGLVKERGRFIRKTPSLASISGQSSCSSSGGLGASNGYHHHHHAAQTNGHHQYGKNGSLMSNGVSPNKYTNGNGTGLSSSPAFLSNGRKATAASVSGGSSASSARAANDRYVYIEHEDNLRCWRELERQYRSYEFQWKSIQPEQELRFSVFRERKALIERDVIRSDRSHPFYAGNSPNLAGLTTLLMTYMMYDFDIGYLQGMSDIAAPILYVYQGDPVKSFWVFVEVMKLFRRNFEHSQKTIHFQLNCLYRLVKLTDAKLGKHLRDNDCSNCFFVFRCIVCQFKRELMKDKPLATTNTGHEANGGNNNGGLSDGLASSAASSSSSASSSECSSSDSSMSGDEDIVDGHLQPDGACNPIVCDRQVESNYNRVLNLWDTIWCVQRRHELLAKSKCVHTFTIANGKTNRAAPASSRSSQRRGKSSAPITITNGTSKQSPGHNNTPSPLSTHSSNGFHHPTLNSSNGNNPHAARRASLANISRSYSYQNNVSCHSPKKANASQQQHLHHHQQCISNNNNQCHHRHHKQQRCCCASPRRRAEQQQTFGSPTAPNSTAPIKQEQIVYTKETFYSSFDPNQADVPRFELTETEKFVLSLCLSLIRRERSQILANQMDATEIHQHFINPRLGDHFDAFVEQAYEVYDYLNTDCDLKLLVRGANELAGEAATSGLSSPVCADELLPETADTYELLKDYLIISPTAYNISMTSLNSLCQKGGGSSPNGNGCHTPIVRRDSSSRYSVSQKSWDQFLNSETLQ